MKNKNEIDLAQIYTHTIQDFSVKNTVRRPVFMKF